MLSMPVAALFGERGRFNDLLLVDHPFSAGGQSAVPGLDQSTGTVGQSDDEVAPTRNGGLPAASAGRGVGGPSPVRLPRQHLWVHGGEAAPRGGLIIQGEVCRSSLRTSGCRAV